MNTALTSRTGRPAAACRVRPAWETRVVSSGAPRTVKAVDTSELIRLDAEAIECRLNRNHGAGWLAAFADPAAVHYLRPVLVHRAAHRPEISPHWRCCCC